MNTRPPVNALLPVLVAASCAVAGAASAQTASPPSPLTALYACADKTDAAERLACYDAAVAAVRAREQASEIVAVDRDQVEAVRREAFGFRLPSLPSLLRPRGAAQGATGSAAAGSATAGAGQSNALARAESDGEDRQTMQVARVGRAGDRTVLTTTSGQVWRLVDAEEFNAPRTLPFTITIRQAALGSFMLTVEGRNKGYRVRRIE